MYGFDWQKDSGMPNWDGDTIIAVIERYVVGWLAQGVWVGAAGLLKRIFQLLWPFQQRFFGPEEPRQEPRGLNG